MAPVRQPSSVLPKACVQNYKSKVKVQLSIRFCKSALTDKNDFATPFLMTPEKAAIHLEGMMRKRFDISFPRPLH